MRHSRIDFGGKGRAAPKVWELLGDPGGYVEPFCGSAAVLLNRPKFKGRRVETVNDADGMLVNFFRSVRADVDAVIEHCYGPVTEIDLHARNAWLAERRTSMVSWLEGDPEAYDPKAAAWWAYVMSTSIGRTWEGGPWHRVDGHLVKTESDATGISRMIPRLGDGGNGIHSSAYTPDGLRAIQRRLETVRITCGDWKRVLAGSVTRATLGNSVTGVFLDPPYDDMSEDLYAHGDDDSFVDSVQEWCLSADKHMRIVVCGYDDGTYAELEAAGWTLHRGLAGSGGGYAGSDNTDRERLWSSPACQGEGLFSFEDLT